MESNFLTAFFLPISLGIIMLGMGLALTIDDFKRVALYPKAAAIGILNQIVVLPVIGFLKLLVFPMSTPELAVGIICGMVNLNSEKNEFIYDL